jgi:hypothetical protein
MYVTFSIPPFFYAKKAAPSDDLRSGGARHVSRSEAIAERSKWELVHGVSMSPSPAWSASMALADHPRVMLPIILYNLVQHLVAGAVGLRLRRIGFLGMEIASRATEPRSAALVPETAST